MISAPHDAGRPYRDASIDRLYICPDCGAPQGGPAHGGTVACSQCRAPHVLPDRGQMLANPASVGMPPDDPARIAQLRAQDARPREVSQSMAALLGGPCVLPGCERDALTIWQSLRARAAQGDVMASDELATMTLLLVQLPSIQQQPRMEQALLESTYDAAVLRRHKQEQLGGLVRLSVRQRERALALRYLSWMVASAPEIDSDSEFRVSSAILATLDGDANRVLALLGPQKDAVPIVDSMGPLASVFRANAYDLLGNVDAGRTVLLRELPSLAILDRLGATYSALRLCARCGPAYVAMKDQRAAHRAAASAGCLGDFVGGSLLFLGLSLAGISIPWGIALGETTPPEVFVAGGIGVVMSAIGATMLILARRAGKRAASLRLNSAPLTARVVTAQKTSTTVNDIHVYELALEVKAPWGMYPATIREVVPEHRVAMLLGHQIRVRANPEKPDEVTLEE